MIVGMNSLIVNCYYWYPRLTYYLDVFWVMFQSAVDRKVDVLVLSPTFVPPSGMISLCVRVSHSHSRNLRYAHILWKLTILCLVSLSTKNQSSVDYRCSPVLSTGYSVCAYFPHTFKIDQCCFLWLGRSLCWICQVLNHAPGPITKLSWNQHTLIQYTVLISSYSGSVLEQTMGTYIKNCLRSSSF